MPARSSTERRFVLPAPDLAPYIERIWTFTADAGAPLPTLLPGTGAELVVHVGEPFTVPGVGRLPAAHLLAPRHGVVPLTATGDVRMLAVRFRVGALRHLTSVPLPELYDDYLPIDHLATGRVARSLARLPERMHDLWPGAELRPGVAAAVQDLVRTMLAARPEPRETAPWLVDRALAALYYATGPAPVEQVAGRLRVSRRHLDRLLSDAIGMSPKHLSRLARFHRASRTILLAAQDVSAPNALDAALSAGYYDQSHFIRDVRSLTGLTPGVLYPAAARSHFYNPSLPGRHKLDVTADRSARDERGERDGNAVQRERGDRRER